MGQSDGLASPEKAGERAGGKQTSQDLIIGSPLFPSSLLFLYPLVANYLKLGKQDGQGVAVLQGAPVVEQNFGTHVENSTY